MTVLSQTGPLYQATAAEGRRTYRSFEELRMLTPRELFRAQGFPDSYIIDPTYNGKPMTKTAQIKMCGNSVCPPLSEALVLANLVVAEESVETA